MRFDGFEELADELRRVADSFEQMSERHGEDTAKEAIEIGIHRAMENNVIPDAKARAPRGDWSDHHHGPDKENSNDMEGERASPGHLKESIDHEQRGWTGDRYNHKYGSTSPYEYAKVQEFGTNKKHYEITPNGDYPLSFFWEKYGFNVQTKAVVHPGVEGSHFMERSLKDNTNQIRGHVGNAVKEALNNNDL